VAETGKPLVVVLLNGSALAVRWASSHANAILESWYPGEEGGLAVAETLQGRNNPSGRLPVTFYSGVEQLPAFEDYSMKGRTYRYFEGVPIYTFGDGLSYSKFVYGKTRVRKPTITAGRPLQVDTEVRNISARDGDEVVEVYITFSGQPGAPTKALRAFTRIHLTAGASQKVSFTLSPRDLSFVNEAGDRMVQGGGYSISVGGSQPGGAAGTVERKFTIVGTMTLPE